MKIGRYLVAFLVLMALLITFGNRGLVDNYLMNRKLASLKKENLKIAAENEELKRKIMLLKEDAAYLEYIARSELGMVRQGDIIYRLVK
ncbi:MAG TPA: septum formation initiator family protein [Smithellaceae bacterium]|nr:septum formation initiator family protein [Smithellaceae bacterium]HRS88928.1 septum formation initiator family protein [Smithellaceae bacterium]HRV26267.1 septum formation initiator family protein [Smithellaceae bacterium]